MPAMSHIESLFCRNPIWQAVAGRYILPWSLQRYRPHGDLLEIGGGSGAMAAQLLRSATADADLTVTVSDFDPAMVTAARANLAGFGEKAKAEVADATELPFKDESFDTVVSFLMLHHVIDWETALGEAARVLRPGGVLAGYDLTTSPPARLAHTLDRSPHRFMARAELHPVLASLPFTDIRISHSPGMIRFRALKSPV